METFYYNTAHILWCSLVFPAWILYCICWTVAKKFGSILFISLFCMLKYIFMQLLLHHTLEICKRNGICFCRLVPRFIIMIFLFTWNKSLQRKSDCVYTAIFSFFFLAEFYCCCLLKYYVKEVETADDGGECKLFESIWICVLIFKYLSAMGVLWKYEKFQKYIKFPKSFFFYFVNSLFR